MDVRRTVSTLRRSQAETSVRIKLIRIDTDALPVNSNETQLDSVPNRAPRPVLPLSRLVSPAPDPLPVKFSKLFSFHNIREPFFSVRKGYKLAFLVSWPLFLGDRKSTRLNSSHGYISYAVFCLKKKKR